MAKFLLEGNKTYVMLPELFTGICSLRINDSWLVQKYPKKEFSTAQKIFTCEGLQYTRRVRWKQLFKCFFQWFDARIGSAKPNGAVMVGIALFPVVLLNVSGGLAWMRIIFILLVWTLVTSTYLYRRTEKSYSFWVIFGCFTFSSFLLTVNGKIHIKWAQNKF